MKKALALVLVALMCLALFAACNPTDKPQETQKPADNPTQAPDNPDVTAAPEGPTPEPEAPKSYTYKTYSTSLGNNWNPHTWETSADSTILDFLSSPFMTMQAENTEDGIYQWVYEMATSVTDVTAEHQDDLTKYACDLGGKEASEITEGYVFEIKLNPNAKWEDGTPINADSYINSMKLLLDPEMKNYRANLYYTGESAVAGGSAYFYQGSEAWTDNSPDGETLVYNVEDLVKGDDGNYVTPEGYRVFITLTENHNWLGGYSLQYYVDNGYSAYLNMENWDALNALCDEDMAGFVPCNDDTIAMFATVITTDDWQEDETNVPYYFSFGVPMPECDYDSTVGCYKVDDYTIRYVNEAAINIYYFYTSCTSTWLVYEPYYTANFQTTEKLKTTKYGTAMDNTMSYGPYKLESLQPGKQITFVQNENWYGWEKQDNGALISYTEYKVNDEHVQRYQTTRIVIDVMDDNAAKQAFLKGDLIEWAPSSEDLPTYGASEQLYKADESYTMSFFFNTNLDDLREMDNSQGNTNSVVLSNTNFRRAFSYSINRAEWVTATAGFKPSFGLMNDSYYYDYYEDPTSMYRSSDPAMQAICDFYGVQYGEGTPYATLKDAYKSINGYNLTLAQELMKTAYNELTEAGIYTGGDIYIRIGWMKGAMSSAENKQVELMNKYINAAVEGSGFGKVTLEGLGNIEDRYSAVRNGVFAIGYGAWGGAQLYPFRNFRVYCDPSYVDIHEAACWDPTVETLTMNVNGEEVTMTWQQWSASMLGTGRFANESNDVKLQITATMEKNYLEKVYRIPLATSTSCTLLSYQADYITPDYNLAYGWGGLELMTYNYDDAAWADFVAAQGGILNYE